MFGQRAVHLRRMPAVEVNRVRVRALVDEGDPHAVAFGRAERRPGHLAVERPRRKEDARRDLDLAIDGDEVGTRAAASRRARRLAIEPRPLGPARDPRSSRCGGTRPDRTPSVETRPTGPIVCARVLRRRSGGLAGAGRRACRARAERGRGSTESGEREERTASQSGIRFLQYYFDYSKS